MLTQYDLWWFGKLAVMAEQGFFFHDVEGEGKSRQAVHPEQDCPHGNCRQAGTPHRHAPTEEQQQEMQSYIRRYREADALRTAGKQDGAEPTTKRAEELWNPDVANARVVGQIEAGKECTLPNCILGPEPHRHEIGGTLLELDPADKADELRARALGVKLHEWGSVARKKSDKT